MTAILRLQLDDKDPVRQNSAINQLAESYDRNARSRLTANTTFYVSTSGSDSNSGTSAASPFRTIQHAYDVIVQTVDTGGFTTTIQCAGGTYTAGLGIVVPWSGGGTVVVDLGGGTISTSLDCISIGCTLPSILTIQNGTLTSSGSHCINQSGGGIVSVGTGMTFGVTSAAHMACAGSGSKITCFNSYTISGGGAWHYLALFAGNTIQGGGTSVAITGTPPAFSAAFANATRLGCIDIQGRTFSGSTTGLRYSVDLNSIIFTAGGGANYFPGTSPGVIGPGGVYA